jgi:hypothetical protein
MLNSTRRSSEFSLNYGFAGLRKPGFSFDAQPPGIGQQLIHTLIRNLPIEKLAHSRLRLSEDYLQLLLRIPASAFQDRLIQVSLKLQSRGSLGRETQVIEHIFSRDV